MAGPVQSWDHANWGTPSLDSVRLLHRPVERFRISAHRYGPGASFTEISRASRRYVLTGACSFTRDDCTWEVHADEFADLPEGQFEFRVLDAMAVELVSVWELPPEFWET